MNGGIEKRSDAIEMRSVSSREESDERTEERAAEMEESCSAFFSRCADLTKQIKSVLRAAVFLRDPAPH